MAHTEQELVSLVQHSVPGRGSYPFFKHIFAQIAREVQPDSLKWRWLEVNPEAEKSGPLDALEDFDLIAMLAWAKSCEVYEAFQTWLRDPEPVYYRLLEDIDVPGWAPSLSTLDEGQAL